MEFANHVRRLRRELAPPTHVPSHHSFVVLQVDRHQTFPDGPRLPTGSACARLPTAALHPTVILTLHGWQEKVAGNVVITVNKGTPLSHEGVHITAEGSASLQLSAKSVGLFEAFYSSIKPTQLFHHTKELKPSGKIPDGRHSLPFEFEIKQTGNEKLLESYHGVYINIQYVITAEIKKGMLSKNMKRSVEFIMEVPEQRVPKEQPSPFAIVPESLENVRKSALSRLPTFKVSHPPIHPPTRPPTHPPSLFCAPRPQIGGQIDSVVCNITQPFSGEASRIRCHFCPRV